MVFLKLDALKLSIASGIVSAVAMFLLVMDAMYKGRGVGLIRLINPVLPGFNVSWYGAGLGVVYGFVGCFIYFGITAWIYNSLPAMKMPKKASRRRK